MPYERSSTNERPYVHFEFDAIERVSERAFLVKPKGFRISVWVPFSIILEDDAEEYYNLGDSGTMCIEQWFAQKHGLGASK